MNLGGIKRKSILPIVLLILLFLLILVFVLSYTSKYKNEQKNSSTVASSSQTMTGNEVSTDEETIGEKSITDKNDFYEISAEYPIDSWDKERVMKNFVLDGVKKMQDEWRIGGNVYNAEQDLNVKFPDRAKYLYEYKMNYKMYTDDEKHTRSYVFQGYQFTGGAHGISFIKTFTFNQSGLVDIQNILNFSEYPKAINLSKILLQKFQAEYPDMYVENMAKDGLGLSYLNSDGSFNKEKCNCDGFNFASNFEKFYVTDERITFLFDQYQIAPGAAGVVKVDLDWQTLAPYLKSDF